MGSWPDGTGAGRAAAALDPTALEIACGQAIGRDDAVGPLPPAPPGTTLRAALEALIADALTREPCGVSFSGGRDSSAVLAIATHVARREGLPLPVPVTLVFPDDPQSKEDDYQRLVVDHLRLPHWERLTFTDELDVIGPIAGPLLRRHGVTIPFNVYFHQPVLQTVRGGTVLTGIGGDELFSAGFAHSANLVLTGRRAPRPLDVARLAFTLAPAGVRRAAVHRRLRAELDPPVWLRPEPARTLVDSWVDDLAGDPVSFRRAVSDVLWPERGRAQGLAALDRLAAEFDAQCVSPFSAAPVLAAAAAQQGFRAFASRRAAMTELVGDLLPARLPARATKALFPATFFSVHAGAFVDGWDGTGLPAELAELVDVAALATMWRTDRADSDAQSYGLLQAAWLGQRGQPGGNA